MSRKGLIFLFFSCCFQTTPSAFAATLSVLSDGSDGSFVPVVSATLSLDNSLTFNFTTVQIGPALTVDFNQGGLLATNFLGTNDIAIEGVLDASRLDLTITTPGRLIIDGELYACSLHLEAADINIAGILGVQSDISVIAGNSISVDQNAGISSKEVTLTAGDIDIINQPLNGGSVIIDGSGVALLPFTPTPISVVPVPAAMWLFGSGLLGLIGGRRRRLRKNDHLVE